MCHNVEKKNSKKAFILIARAFLYVEKMQKIAKNNRNIASIKSLNHTIYRVLFSQFFYVATLAIIHKRRNLPILATSQRGKSILKKRILLYFGYWNLLSKYGDFYT